MSLVNLGNASSTISEDDEALVYLERAPAIDEATVGPDHPDVARSLMSLGTIRAIRRRVRRGCRLRRPRARDPAPCAWLRTR